MIESSYRKYRSNVFLGILPSHSVVHQLSHHNSFVIILVSTGVEVWVVEDRTCKYSRGIYTQLEWLLDRTVQFVIVGTHFKWDGWSCPYLSGSSDDHGKGWRSGCWWVGSSNFYPQDQIYKMTLYKDKFVASGLFSSHISPPLRTLRHIQMFQNWWAEDPPTISGSI